LRGAAITNKVHFADAVALITAGEITTLSNIVYSEPAEYCHFCPANHAAGNCAVFDAKKNSANAQGVGAAWTRYCEGTAGKNVLRDTQKHGIEWVQQLSGCHVPAFAKALQVEKKK